MARVVFNRLLLDWIEPARRPNEESSIAIDANNIRSLIRQLNLQFPGLGDQLQSGYTVAIDGEIFSDPLLEPLEPDSEVYFLPAIEGG